MEYNQVAKTGYEVGYTNSSTKVESNLKATTLGMETGIGPKVETKLTAKVGGAEINQSVKNGEVIKYQIEVSNIGTEDVTNVQVAGKVPEGTSMVIPDDREEGYEYLVTSYYQELDDDAYEDTIESLKVGETITKEYEVRVNKQTQANAKLINQAEIKYNDVTTYSEEIENVTATGNLMVSAKRVTDRKVELTEGGNAVYSIMIENISNQEQKDVTVSTNISEGLEVQSLKAISVKTSNQGTSYGDDEILTYSNEVNVGTLATGETKVLTYIININDLKNHNGISLSATVKSGKETYQSNVWTENVKNVEIGMSMTSNTTSQYVGAGDEIEYTMIVENKSESDISGLNIINSIPKQLTIKEVVQDGNVVEQEMTDNRVSLYANMKGKDTSTIAIKALVNYSEARDEAEAITDVAHAEFLGKKVATTSEINHIIKANKNSSGSGNENGENGSNNVNNNDVANGSRTITGLAWFDENANGQKEQGEALLSDIKVRLLNTETNNFVKRENGQILEATTNDNGIYVLDKVGNGKYIAIFDYDNSNYSLTKYQVSGVSEEENSNAIMNELLIENEKRQVASTDIIEIQDNDITGINIGLIKLENFDLKLDKYVSKILIQNSKGTTVREYNNETMAKVELDAKTVNGSTVIIEYKIDVTNNGEVEGYAKKIADYASTDLKFSSELNKDWYQMGDTLYTSSLANEKIQPGETKTVTLTLTKAMTEDNTGLIPNTAEIAEDYNELGITDSNSTPGNRVKAENDFGSAEVLLSIRTGGIVYITITIVVVAILGVVSVVIIKRRKEQEKE